MKRPPSIEMNAADSALLATIEDACRRVPPLWPLQRFVAVNPFLGLTERPFIEAARLLQRVGHGDILMPAAHYREQIAAGRIREEDFRTAIELAAQSLPPTWKEQLDFTSLNSLNHALASGPAAERQVLVLTFADFLAAHKMPDWPGFVREEVSKWCSAYYDAGQSSWRMPWRDRPLLAAWRAAAQLDANPELNGLRGFRAWVRNLPDDPAELIGLALEELGIPAQARTDFLHRQLLSIAGWSGHVQFRVREQRAAGATDDSLTQLLAVRLAYDLALWRQCGSGPEILPRWRAQQNEVVATADGFSADLLARFVAQLALESSYQRQLLGRLRANPERTNPLTGPKMLQAVFCIDVRSEVFRRALEAQSPAIETLGFAGFFGMAFAYRRFGQEQGTARCPVLLHPKVTVCEAPHAGAAAEEARLWRRLHFKRSVGSAWNAFKTSAISCFSFVETAGLWFGVKLAQDGLGLARPEAASAPAREPFMFGPRFVRATEGADSGGQCEQTGWSLAERIDLAAGALKNMGLTKNFAKVVLLCGHGSATTNNPYASALDCGACGGHAGDANARVAAAILNDPAVRDGLRARGMTIPEETVFVAGLHNTTTDEVVMYDVEKLAAEPAAALRQCQAWLAAASRQARRERAASLGLGDLVPAQLDAAVHSRSRDWAQVRPEWGLAGNAAFIAAPRALTAEANLGGRVFLHNYDAERDADASVLELILTAPMVVASWINLQYYGSTVNNRLFGSGNKVLHNVVGTFGIWEGNGGDLQTGLPLQSLHDGVRWRHEPLRLTVILDASRAAIDEVLQKHGGVRDLVENGWVNLFAREPGDGLCWRCIAAATWVAVPTATVPAERPPQTRGRSAAVRAAAVN